MPEEGGEPQFRASEQAEEGDEAEREELRQHGAGRGPRDTHVQQRDQHIVEGKVCDRDQQAEAGHQPGASLASERIRLHCQQELDGRAKDDDRDIALGHAGERPRTIGERQHQAVANGCEQRDQCNSDHQRQHVGAGEDAAGFSKAAGAEMAGKQARHAADDEGGQRHGENEDRKHRGHGADGFGADIDAEHDGIGHRQQPVHAHDEDDRQRRFQEGRAERRGQVGIRLGVVLGHPALLFSHFDWEEEGLALPATRNAIGARGIVRSQISPRLEACERRGSEARKGR